MRLLDMITRLGAAALLLGTALVLSGCEDHATVHAQTQLTTDTSAEASTSAATSVTSSLITEPITSTPAPTVTIGADLHVAVVPAEYGTYGYAWFETPSHRIACGIWNELVTCEVDDPAWRAEAWNGECDVDLVPTAELKGKEQGRAVTSCQGDTVGGGPVLGYGTTVTAGDLSCTSETTGLTCRSSATKHGFTVSRASFDGF